MAEMMSNSTEKNIPQEHTKCAKCINSWCGQWGCPNQPELTEGRSCSMCFASPACIENFSWCGSEMCVNYDFLMMNPRPLNSYIGSATSPWQPNENTGRAIPGLNRCTYTEQEQQQIIEHLNSLEVSIGETLSDEAMLQAVLEFMPK
tara:strand:- start:7 stop:447 length:441 start_codon:yes stop_codon:yes gene_type:complete